MVTNEILFLHGLESTPEGSKAQWLKARYGSDNVKSVDLDTSHAIVSRDKAKALGVPWGHTWPDIEADFAVPLMRTKEAITPSTKLIVGSSFGAAVLTRLIQEGFWKGPSLLIASAGLKLTGKAELPTEAPVVLLHGLHDDVVPFEDSCEVVDANGRNVSLWLAEDGHRMDTILTSGMFESAVSQLFQA